MMIGTLSGLNKISEKILTIVVLNVIVLFELILTLGIFGIGPAAVGVFAVFENKKNLNVFESIKYQIICFKESFFKINRCNMYNHVLTLLMGYTWLVIEENKSFNFENQKTLLITMLIINLFMILIKAFLYQQFGITGKEIQKNTILLFLIAPFSSLKLILLLITMSYLGHWIPILMVGCLIIFYLMFLYTRLNKVILKINKIKEKQIGGKASES